MKAQVAFDEAESRDNRLRFGRWARPADTHDRAACGRSQELHCTIETENGLIARAWAKYLIECGRKDRREDIFFTPACRVDLTSTLHELQRTSVIVRYIDDRLLLISQPDHAHLAADIMSHATALDRHPRRDTILQAIASHDNGWAIEDAKPSIDPATGEVADFIRARTEVRQGVWPRAVGSLAEENPWAAALVAHHALTVYSRLRANPDWHGFFTRMGVVRDALLKKSRFKPLDLEADYVFLRLGDLISLAFCTGSNDLNQFSGYRVELFRDRVIVTPDLFAGMEIPIQITAAELPEKRFRSDDDLHDALTRATPTSLVGTVSYR